MYFLNKQMVIQRIRKLRPRQLDLIWKSCFTCPPNTCAWGGGGGKGGGGRKIANLIIQPDVRPRFGFISD
jgi:hypothetical protein